MQGTGTGEGGGGRGDGGNGGGAGDAWKHEPDNRTCIFDKSFDAGEDLVGLEIQSRPRFHVCFMDSDVLVVCPYCSGQPVCAAENCQEESLRHRSGDAFLSAKIFVMRHRR